jgi:hypothetical protein
MTTLEGWIKETITWHDGSPMMVLVNPGADLGTGVPLLDLAGLGLPEDLETALREHLIARGICEYADALAPGGAEKVMSALKATLRVALSDVLSLCERESNLLEVSGYG